MVQLQSLLSVMWHRKSEKKPEMSQLIRHVDDVIRHVDDVIRSAEYDVQRSIDRRTGM